MSFYTDKDEDYQLLNPRKICYQCSRPGHVVMGHIFNKSSCSFSRSYTGWISMYRMGYKYKLGNYAEIGTDNKAFFRMLWMEKQLDIYLLFCVDAANYMASTEPERAGLFMFYLYNIYINIYKYI